MRNLVLIFLIFSSFSLAQNKSDKEEIKQLVKGYYNVINGKDSTKISAFLFNENVNWIGTYKPKTLEELSHHNHKLRPVFSGDFKNFNPDVSEGKNSEVRYDNLKIIEDGNVASVNLDYSFWTDGKMKHWGKEVWTLVKVFNQWKITNIVYSLEYVEYAKQPSLKQRLKNN
jgi:hypothetical protein